MLKCVTPLIKHVLCRLADCDSGPCPLIKKKKRKKNQFSTPLTHPALCSPFQSACLFHQNPLVPAAHTHTHTHKQNTLVHSSVSLRALRLTLQTDEMKRSRQKNHHFFYPDLWYGMLKPGTFPFFFFLSRCALFNATLVERQSTNWPCAFHVHPLFSPFVCIHGTKTEAGRSSFSGKRKTLLIEEPVF